MDILTLVTLVISIIIMAIAAMFLFMVWCDKKIDDKKQIEKDKLINKR
jgi:hypothetical protein